MADSQFQPAANVEHPFLLLVEGTDDYWFFRRIMERRQSENIQIIQFNGKDNLGNFLVNALVPSIMSSDVVKAIGIIRDADDSYARAFQSVGDSLRRAGLPVPSAPLSPREGTLSDAAIRVVAYILPDNRSTGDLEVLCLGAVSRAAAMPCVAGYFDCLGSIDHIPRQESKARLSVFLSANQDNPNLLIGQAVAAGVIPWDSPVFDNIHQFLDVLASIN